MQHRTTLSKTGLLACLIWLAVAGWLPAAIATENPVDYDGDGVISEEEFRNYATRRALAADRNGNQILDDSEHGLANGDVLRVDRNRDGAIQLGEYQAFLMESMAAADTNGDGRLDAREQKAAKF
ncbi:MAG TPA: hypothetical protein DCL54_01305 [Alphaproteobacteria bacterium]|nr:hypothetical protein [Alphaproteobacteria bacterium]HAJ45203.1 hypothetical protein [Alphaproteobacteria bacterium]